MQKEREKKMTPVQKASRHAGNKKKDNTLRRHIGERQQIRRKKSHREEGKMKGETTANAKSMRKRKQNRSG